MPESFWPLLGAFLLAGAIVWAGASLHAARLHRRHAARRARYLEGLRYVLDDKPDRALEVFLDLAALDDETVETHFALGTLYRRRGEVDRAIRVHQKIVERDDLDVRHHDAAVLELGRDYFRAGLYDRAETLFQRFADSAGRDTGTALSYLIRIYEHQHDWAQAAQTHERLRRVGAPQQASAIAHYHCEQAELALRARQLDVARAHLRDARREQHDFGRSAILRGDLARLEADPALAMRLYRSVVMREFHLLPLVLPRLDEMQRDGAWPSAVHDTLAELIGQGRANPSEIAYAAITSGHYDDPAILSCVRELMVTDNDLRDVSGALLPPGHVPDEHTLRSVASALRNVVQRHARYRCSICGLDSSTFLWHCPGCQSWDTLRAMAALEFLPRAARPRSPE